MAIVVYNSLTSGTTSLPPNTDTKIVGIQLNTGNNRSPFWTVFGKVVVNNTTASPATVYAHLKVAVPPTVLDTSKATIPANGFVSIPLEGALPATEAAMLRGDSLPSSIVRHRGVSAIDRHFGRSRLSNNVLKAVFGYHGPHSS